MPRLQWGKYYYNLVGKISLTLEILSQPADRNKCCQFGFSLCPRWEPLILITRLSGEEYLFWFLLILYQQSKHWDRLNRKVKTGTHFIPLTISLFISSTCGKSMWLPSLMIIKSDNDSFFSFSHWCWILSKTWETVMPSRCTTRWILISCGADTKMILSKYWLNPLSKRIAASWMM